MTNLKNIRINENEAQRVLDLLNTKLVQKITIGKLLENISISKTSPEDYWSIKVSEQDALSIEHSKNEYILEISIDHLLNSRKNPY